MPTNMVLAVKTAPFILLFSVMTACVNGNLFHGDNLDCGGPSNSPIKRSNDDPNEKKYLRPSLPVVTTARPSPSKCLEPAPILQMGKIGGFVWKDSNKNGLSDNTESPFKDVVVKLFNKSNNLVDETVTDENGKYQFDGINPGEYYIKFINPSGYAFSTQNVGGDDGNDSDPDVTGNTSTFTVSPNANLKSDAGLIHIQKVNPQCACENREDEIRDVLSEVSSPWKLSNMNTAQGKAFNWIVNIDPLQLCPKCVIGCQFIQRYTMALFYYSTEGDGWSNCGEQSGNCVHIDGKMPCNSGSSSRWLSGDNECDWCGNMCNEDMCLTEIQIEKNNQKGFIADEISELTNLVDIRLEKGEIGGTIPTTIGKLTKLNFLDLDYQILTGTLPDGLWSLTELTTIDLNDNKLTGTIDIGIGNLINLDFVQMQYNEFSGPIPDVFGGFTKIKKVQLEGNNLSGAMPNSLCGHRCAAGITNTDSCLSRLRSDCGGPTATVSCSAPDCCDDCPMPV